MKIDFHTHGKLAKKLPFSEEYTRLLFKEARIAGLDVICLTEHFNTIGYNKLYEYIADNYPRHGDAFLAEGVLIFSGMEVDIAEGGHILAIGTPENILAMNQELEPNKENCSFIEFSELLILAERYDIILGAAHPFRESSNITSLPLNLLKNLNFIDLNGKDYAVNGEKSREEVYNFAKSLNLPVVAGSDTHQSFQYGCIWNQFEKSCTTIEELKEAIRSQSYKIEIPDYISLKVSMSGVLKKALKEIHACGGDYVAVLADEK